MSGKKCCIVKYEHSILWEKISNYQSHENSIWKNQISRIIPKRKNHHNKKIFKFHNSNFKIILLYNVNFQYGWLFDGINHEHSAE